ncbi:MAG: ATP-binding cassette domain-containing protein [Bacteroides stercoris]
MSKIEIRNLYLIFGKEKHKAEKMLKEGKTKEEILKVTGCTVAVKDANLSINEGEIFVIMGLSGSGKSTLLRCTQPTNTSTSGEIIINDTDISEGFKATTAANTHERNLPWYFSTSATTPPLRFAQHCFRIGTARSRKEKREKKAMECMQQVGLKGYENQMVEASSPVACSNVSSLARALANNLEVLRYGRSFLRP